MPRAEGGILLRVVDAGLIGIICIAPFFFGGRHDAGRLVLVSLIAVTAVAWFLRQAMLGHAAWPRTSAYALVLLAAGMLVLQIVPLPDEWIQRLSPRLAQLLPLWSSGAEGVPPIGTWRTLSLIPHETTKSLAMLLSYGLLLMVVAGRIQTVADVRRLLGWVGLAAFAMAVFGVVQYFTSDGRFFWFYAHPYRPASTSLCGAFINRNHFAHFLILGIGPLVAWLLHVIAQPSSEVTSQQPRRSAAVAAWLLAAAIATVMLVSIASRSRGGAVTLIAAVALLIIVYFYRGVVDSRFLYGLFSFAVVVCAVLSWPGYDQVVNRLGDLTEGSIEGLDRNGARRAVWLANIASIKTFPIVGTGAGSHCQICPVFLQESFRKEYTHAENGYLQIATENGATGAVLLAILLCTVGWWCLKCLLSDQPARDVHWFGAAAAGLAASAIHSLVDFVWYIPACMSATIVLAGCMLRLSQFASAKGSEEAVLLRLPRGRWLELAAAALLVGGWSVYTYVGPAVAAVHWERYLRASVASSDLADDEMAAFVAAKDVTSQEKRRALSGIMIRHLEAAVAWDPKFARAHRRLADRYLAEFELGVADAANALKVAQIRDAASVSSFASAEELRSWLVRAFGPNVRLLYLAQQHSQRAVELCPLQGDVYLRMAELAFLDLGTMKNAEAQIEQGLLVRPHDRNVLIRAGRQAFVIGRYDLAVQHWAKCFNTPGRHQKEITYRLVAAGMPAKEFLAHFQPDWRTLREVWTHYKISAQQIAVDEILNYAEVETRREIAEPGGTPPASVWYWQSQLYADAGRGQESLDCLQRAYACDPRQYVVRQALARSLQANQRYTEAEPHIRWCLARKPSDKSLRAALEVIAKARVEQRKAMPPIDSRWKHNVSQMNRAGRSATMQN